MARARNIKPAFFKNEELVELPFDTRLLFIGLWTLADRDGKLENRPKRIKMEVFPGDNIEVGRCLDELAEAGFLDRYELNGSRVIKILNFVKHQNPHHKEKLSELPDKPEKKAKPKEKQQSLDKPGADPGQDLGKDAPNTEPTVLIPESPNLNPESLILNPEPPTTEAEDGWGEIPKSLQTKEFKATWSNYKAWVLSKQGNWSDITGMLILKDCIASGLEKSIADLELTMKTARNVGKIFDSDREKRYKPAQEGGKSALRLSIERGRQAGSESK